MVDWERFDAVLFDLDGVLTSTEKLHAACWKAMFDEYLLKRSIRDRLPFNPFDIELDYRMYVDGRPRYNGVENFLVSRGIVLPWGEQGDSPSVDTICGLGNRKNELIREMLRLGGVEVYSGSKALVLSLRERGKKLAVVSSSRNCRDVLRAAGIEDHFDCIVDGLTADVDGLKGKPDPETFLEAARRLETHPSHTVVIEDAISGVQAGQRGGFALVIGVARHGEAEILRESGADLVVEDLSELLNGC